MKRPAGATEPEASDDGDDGRSVLFWLAIAVVVAIPVLIAVTVIGAAVIGSFVLGVDGGTTQSPAVQLEPDYDESDLELTIVHQAGDTIDVSQLEVVVEGEETEDWTASDEEVLSAGSEITVEGVQYQDEVLLVWESPDGEERTVLASFSAI